MKEDIKRELEADRAQRAAEAEDTNEKNGNGEDETVKDDESQEEIDTQDEEESSEDNDNETSEDEDTELVRKDSKQNDSDSTGVQKRIDKLTARAKAAEEKLAQFERQKIEEAAAYQSLVDPETNEILSEPDPAEYSTATEYAQASKHYSERKKSAEIIAEAYQKQQQEMSALQQNLRKSAEIAREKYSDFSEVEKRFTANDFPVSEGMAAGILSSDKAADILYYLAKNESEAKRLASLPRDFAIKEIGKIEARFLAQKKIPSKAPKPLAAEKSGAQSPENSLQNMSLKDLQNRWRTRPIK